GGCGGTSIEGMSVALSAGSGLDPADVQSVQVLVLGGDRATCDRALQPHSPLDDPELVVVRHALFTVDGAAKRLSGIPAGEPLVFYVDAFKSPDGSRPRVGRGCTEATIDAGQSAMISITLQSAPDN